MVIAVVLLAVAVAVLVVLLLRQQQMSRQAAAAGEEAARQTEHLKLELQHLSHTIVEEQARRLNDDNARRMDALLRPLQVHLEQLNRAIHDNDVKSAERKVSFDEAMVRMGEVTQLLGKETSELTRALKGESKTQGDWGEMILETILQQSGLTRGREYQTQVSFKNAQGRLLRPDVVVDLPDDRKVVIDSKVSLTAYMAYQQATDDETRATALTEHVKSVRRHVDELAVKAYPDLMERACRHVLLFLQSDAALSLALSTDPTLNCDALKKNIVITGPTTLMMTLQIVEHLWQTERQNRNIRQIALKAGALYDKLVVMTDSVQELGRCLNRARESYDKMRGQLSEGRGNLVKQAEELHAMGLTTKRRLPQELCRQALDSYGGGADSADETASEAEEPA